MRELPGDCSGSRAAGRLIECRSCGRLVSASIDVKVDAPLRVEREWKPSTLLALRNGAAILALFAYFYVATSGGFWFAPLVAVSLPTLVVWFSWANTKRPVDAVSRRFALGVFCSDLIRSLAWLATVAVFLVAFHAWLSHRKHTSPSRLTSRAPRRATSHEPSRQ